MNTEEKKQGPPEKGGELGRVQHALKIQEELIKRCKNIPEEVRDLSFAEALRDSGKFETVREAAEWMEEINKRQMGLSELPPEKLKEAMEDIAWDFRKVVPKGSKVDREMDIRFFKLLFSPDEVERLRRERDRLKDEIEQLRRERDGADRLGAVPPNFQALRQLELFPVDPKAYEMIPQIIPDDLSKNELIYEGGLPDGSRVLKYQKKYDTHRTTYTWIIPEGIKGGIPTVGRLARKIALATYGFYFQQRRNGPEIRPAEILSLVGYDEKQLQAGGKKYDILVNVYRTLAYGTYEMESKIRGKWKVERVGHFFSEVNFAPGKKKINVIRPYLAPYFREELDKLLMGDKGGRYFPVYTKELQAGLDTISRDAERLLHRLGKYRGYTKPIGGDKGFTIRKIFSHPDWLGYSTSRMKSLRPKAIATILLDITTAALNAGIRYEYDYKGNASTKSKAAILNWRIKFFMPQIKKKARLPTAPLLSQPVEQDLPGLSGDLADEITAWLTYQQFNTKKPAAEVRIEVANCIKKYGDGTIGKIFQQEANANSPHPINFWNRIKELKAKRLGGPEVKRTGKEPKPSYHRPFRREDLAPLNT